MKIKIITIIAIALQLFVSNANAQVTSFLNQVKLPPSTAVVSANGTIDLGNKTDFTINFRYGASKFNNVTVGGTFSCTVGLFSSSGFLKQRYNTTADDGFTINLTDK